MQLDEALRQISNIRQQMARAEVFRGYRAVTVGFSGVMGLVAAGVQGWWIERPGMELGRFLALWVGVAGVCAAVAGVEVFWRARRAGAGLVREQTLVAAEQFVPFVVVGGLLTLCVYRGAPDVGWMLPGLWAMVYGLGVFASRRMLPWQAFWVAAYYVLCGCACLLLGRGENVLSPWQMGVSFGGGQLLSAGILYWALERER